MNTENKCTSCGSVTQPDFAYCPKCGKLLDHLVGSLQHLVEEQVSRFLEAQRLSSDSLELRLKQLLKSETVNQEFIEAAVAAKVVEKLQGMAKSIGYFVGIPLTLFSVGLTFFGIKTYADFQRNMDNLLTPTTAELSHVKALGQSNEVAQKNLKNELDKLASALDSAEQKIASLSTTANKAEASLQDVKDIAGSTATRFQEFKERPTRDNVDKLIENLNRIASKK